MDEVREEEREEVIALEIPSLPSSNTGIFWGISNLKNVK